MLRRPFSAKGPLLAYIEDEASRDPQGRLNAQAIVSAVRAVLASPEGAMLLDLLDAATSRAHDPGADPRALSAMNAQRLIPHDLMRIAGNESEALLGSTGAGSARRGKRGG